MRCAALTVGSLFAGIGGFDLGFERAGFEIKWQCEIDPFARAVLATHWPNVTRYEDVRTLRDPEPVDVLCGGFPCQPHSLAGRRGGAADERDLWPEYARLVRELGPRWVVAENVPGLLSSDAGRFFGTVLGDLAACGYDAEWDCLPASAFGAPHRRDRVWIVAYPHKSRLEGRNGGSVRECAGERLARSRGASVADAECQRREWFSDAQARRASEAQGSNRAELRRQEMAHAARYGRREDVESLACSPRIWTGCGLVAGSGARTDGHWLAEPNVGRVAHGIPARVDRLRGLGNAIVPQIAQWIAERIKEAEGIAN